MGDSLAIMAENLFCDHCSAPATVFGFTQPLAKVKACREHICVLLDKRITIFDIDAFRFIETPQDISEFEERRRRKQASLGQIDALESQCEHDWTQNQQRLRTNSDQMLACINRIYTEMWLRSQQRYTHIKQQLQSVRSRLNRYTQDRHFSLSPEDSVFDTTFTVEVGDCRLFVAQKLMSAFSAGPVSASPVDSEKELNLLLVLSASEASVSDTAEACERTSEAAWKVGDFSLAVAELERGRSFLQQHSRYSLDLPLACTFAQSNQYSSTHSLCQHILESDRSAFERLSALYYLTRSLYCAKEYKKAYGSIEKWTGQLAVDSSDSQCVLLYIQARKSLTQGRVREAKELYEQALNLGVLSASYMTAGSLEDLGYLYSAEGNKAEAERQRLRSFAIYSEHFPFAYDFGVCLSNMGKFYVQINRLEDAEERLMQAHQLLSLHFPQSAFMGICLHYMGRLLEKIGEKRAARERFEAALPLLKEHGRTRILALAEAALKSFDS